MEQLVRKQPHDFRIDPDSLIALKKGGVPDNVVLAIVQVTLLGPPLRTPVELKESGGVDLSRASTRY
jgi:hypothetical protein